MKRAEEIFSYIAPKYGITLEEWNHDGDHVHVMFRAQPKSELSRFINAYKSASSRLIKKEYPQIREKLWKEALWSQSFCLLSAGGAPIETIRTYIENAGEVWCTYPAEEGLYTWYCDLESASVTFDVESVKEFAKSEKDIQKMLDKVETHHKIESERYIVRKKDGYHTPGGVYQYRLVLTGRARSAVRDSTLVVYTNEKNLTFDDASRVMFSSQMPEKPEMYISYRESPDFVESQKN